MCYCAEKRETSITVIDSWTSQTAVTVASQTDEDVTSTQRSTYSSLVWVIHQFLAHMIDIKRGNLIDKLVTNGILISDERERIKKPKKNKDKVRILVSMLLEKSAAEFESFLSMLSETGQLSVANVVRLALRKARKTGQNLLQSLNYGRQFSNSEYVGLI